MSQRSDRTLSEFSIRVLSIIKKIKRGTVMTYGEVAERAGRRGAARAVVALLRAHSETQGLPWHRVVGRGPRISLLGEAGRKQQEQLRSEGVLLERPH